MRGDDLARGKGFLLPSRTVRTLWGAELVAENTQRLWWGVNSLLPRLPLDMGGWGRWWLEELEMT